MNKSLLQILHQEGQEVQCSVLSWAVWVKAGSPHSGQAHPRAHWVLGAEKHKNLGREGRHKAAPSWTLTIL